VTVAAPDRAATLAERAAAIAPSLRLAARRFGTPSYVTDVSAIARAAQTLRSAFPDPWIRRYSVKANDVPSIVAAVARHGDGANVVSRGEWAVARDAGIRNEHVSLEGIGKSPRDLSAAVRAARDGRPLAWVSIESPDEAGALAALATRAHLGRDGGPPLDVLLRLNPDVSPETAPGLAVGLGASKFGMDETELTAVLERLPPSLVARGVHVHVGSQLGAVDAWRDGARRAIALVALIRPGRDPFDTVDLGGGFPVPPADRPAPSPDQFARQVEPILAATPEDRRPRRLAIEPGRFLVARAGWLLARVLHARSRAGGLVVLDAGMTELISPALYGATHDLVALTSLGRPLDDPVRTGQAEGDEVEVDGPICESTDRLGRHRLPPLRRGDLVAIADAGAYAASLSSTYNGRRAARQVLVEADGSLHLARARRGP
jgi:diaminopimelate decarboxylase